MDEKKKVSSRGDVEPDPAAESESVSRRSFMRKSAEVAALSLFGVLGLDAVMDGVLERIAENQAMGRLSDAAARALRAHRAENSASAGVYDWACNLLVPNNCDYYGHVCHQTFACNLQYEVYCNKFRAGCPTPGHPYACTVRHLTCCNEFWCDINACVPIEQEGGKFSCPEHHNE